MAKVVNNLLHFARHYEPNVSPCRLGDLVRSSVEALRAHLTRAQIEVVIEGPAAECEADLDADLVLQVFKNVLLNSVDASPEASTLRVRLFGPDRTGEVAVAFRDEGQGIGPDVIGRIFDPFFTSKPNGVGLGLSVSKKIVEAHNGRIQVQSEPGGGATFTVTFPRTAAEQRQRLAA
jgi:signal transduction histidine kinase